MTTARANRIAVTVIAAGLVALGLVLGLWRGVDAACGGAEFDPTDPVGTCQSPAEADLGQVGADPVPALPTGH